MSYTHITFHKVDSTDYIPPQLHEDDCGWFATRRATTNFDSGFPQVRTAGTFPKSDSAENALNKVGLAGFWGTMPRNTTTVLVSAENGSHAIYGGEQVSITGQVTLGPGDEIKLSDRDGQNIVSVRRSKSGLPILD